MAFAIVLLLLVGSAFFAGTELAVTMASRVRMRTRAEGGSRAARYAERLLRYPERSIALCLVGNNLVNVGLAVYGRQALLSVAPLSEAGVNLLTMLIFVPVLLLWGEILPKAVSQTYPNRVLHAAAIPLSVLRVLLAPLMWVALGVAELVRRLAGFHTRALEFASREELKQFVARSELRGHVDPDERNMIYQIFEFWKLDPRTLVRPLDSMPTLPQEASSGEAKELMRQRRLARLLVTDAAAREVVGVVNATRLLDVDNRILLQRVANTPVHVDFDLGLDTLLAELQRHPSQTAVLRAANGEIGVILLDDLLDQLLQRTAAAT